VIIVKGIAKKADWLALCWRMTVENMNVLLG
jgi:hypothetical protein